MSVRRSGDIGLMAAAFAMVGVSCTYLIGVDKDYTIASADGVGGDAGAGGQGGGGQGGGGQGGNPSCGPGQDHCGSGCADLDTPENCGGCGRNCNGDACVAGLCAVTTIGTTTAPGPASAVAVDTTHVYWADRAGGQVIRSGLDGSSATPLVTGHVGLLDIELSGGKLCWTSGTDVGVVDIGGGGEVSLATGEQGSFGITVHMDFAYWTSFGSGVLRGAPVDGTMPASNQSTVQQNAPGAIVNDGVNLYWANQPSDGEIMVMPIGSNQETLLMEEEAPRELAISNGSLYWVRQLERSIVRMPVMAMQTLVTVVSGLGQPQGLAVDGDDVYFTVNEGQTCEVMRARADGTGAPLKLADGCTDSPFGLTVDATHVYWSDVNDKAVKKVAR